MLEKTNRGQMIVKAAERLFSSKGYHGTTIRDIAQERGILSGSLYAHIDSKEDLLFHITNEGADAFLEGLEPIANGSGLAVTKLRLGLAVHIQVVADHLDAARVFFHEWRALSTARRAVIQAKRDCYESYWTTILAAGVATGEFRLIDTKFSRLLILSVANSVYEWYDPNGSANPAEVADHYANLILQGIGQGICTESSERKDDP